MTSGRRARRARPRGAAARGLWSAVLPDGAQVQAHALLQDALGDGEGQPLLQEGLDVGDDVVVARVALHVRGSHVRGDLHPAGGDQPGELGRGAEGGDVVDVGGAGVQRRLGDRALGRVDRYAGRRPGREGATTGSTRRRSSSALTKLGAEPRGLAADVEDVGALGGQRPALGDRASASRKRRRPRRVGAAFTTPMRVKSAATAADDLHRAPRRRDRGRSSSRWSAKERSGVGLRLPGGERFDPARQPAGLIDRHVRLEPAIVITRASGHRASARRARPGRPCRSRPRRSARAPEPGSARPRRRCALVDRAGPRASRAARDQLAPARPSPVLVPSFVAAGPAGRRRAASRVMPPISNSGAQSARTSRSGAPAKGRARAAAGNSS